MSSRKPRVLLTCLFADFGQNGNMIPDFSNASWEYHNIYKPWKQISDDGLVELETYWTDQQSPSSIERLISLAKDVDFVFSVPVTHALGIHLPQAQKIIAYGTPIVSYHPDLHMRYRHPCGDDLVGSYIREGYTTHVITPAKHMMPRLISDGVKSYCMPFGIPSSCQRLDGVEQIYDVSFVGQKHGIRERVVSQLRAAGILVHTWGGFWPPHKDYHGRPTVAEMVHIFNRSRVNINLRWCSRSPSHGQIKGRCLELLGCGAFMLATRHDETDDFHQLYTPGKEFVEYHYVKDMVDGIKYYLGHDAERQAIADAALLKREQNLWTTRLKDFLKSGFWLV